MTDEHNDFSVDASEDTNLDDFSAGFFSADKAPVKDNPEESDNGNAPSHETDETNKGNEADETSETDEADEGDEGDEGEGETKPVKKKSRFQERIDDLTAKLREQERLAKAADDRLAKALEKLESAAPKAEDTQNTNTQKTDNGLVEPTADDLLEDGTPKYPLGEFDPKLLRDLTRYDRAVERAHEEKVNATAKLEREQAEKFNTLQVEWNGKVESAKEVYPDYVEKGQELLNSLQDVPQDYAVYLTTSLMNMDYGPDVFYYLAEHPEEARAIVNSSPEKALTRLGRIEARFEIAAAEQSGKETKLRTTNAPTPAPRNKGSNAAAPSINLADASLDDFEREFFRKK